MADYGDVFRVLGAGVRNTTQSIYDTQRQQVKDKQTEEDRARAQKLADLEQFIKQHAADQLTKQDAENEQVQGALESTIEAPKQAFSQLGTIAKAQGVDPAKGEVVAPYRPDYQAQVLAKPQATSSDILGNPTLAANMSNPDVSKAYSAMVDSENKAQDSADLQKKYEMMYSNKETPEQRAAREQENIRLRASVAPVPKGTYQGSGKPAAGVNTAPNPEDDRIASDLAFGKIAPEQFNRMYSKFKGNDERMRNVYLLAKDKNPDFDIAEYNADYTSFKNNAQRTQMSNLLRAENLLDTYQGLSDAVHRNDLVGFNKIGNKIGLELSGLDQTNLKTMQTVMTEDLSRALTQSGATSDAKMKMAGDIADVMDVSNKAASSKIKILHEIIDANKQAIRNNMGVFGENANKKEFARESSGGKSTTAEPSVIKSKSGHSYSF